MVSKKKQTPVKVVDVDEVVTLEIKRCYLPFILTDTCPECGVEVSKDLTCDYLSYPRVGAEETVYFCHWDEGTGDDHEWEREVMITVKIEAL